jgi:transcriptional regulator with XRE-family HTH domain
MRTRERIAKNIRKHRKVVGLSQENLAKVAGISRTHLGRIENSRHSLSLDTLARIAVAVGVDIVELLRPPSD